MTMNGSILNVDKYKVIILDNFYDQHEYDAILNECVFFAKRDKLKPPSITGAAEVHGVSLKKGNGIFLDDVFKDRNISDILYYNRKIFNSTIMEELSSIDIFYRNLSMSNKDSTLLNYYENSDYYDSHSDLSTITVVSWFYKEPKIFSGGNIFFENDKEKFVECKNNRVIFFPSFLYHAVDKIEMPENKLGLGLGRFAISQFIRNS